MDIIEFHPKYVTYFTRSIHYIGKSILLILIVPFLFLIFNKESYFIYSIYFIVLFAGVSFIHSFLINFHYLNKLIFDLQTKQVFVEIKKGDKDFFNKEYDLNEIEIDIVKVWYSRYPRFYLQIKSKNKIVINQHTVGNWNKELFITILKSFKDMSDKPFYSHYLGSQD